MATSAPPGSPPLLRATFLGWLLGIPCVAGLALLSETLRVGGLQSPVGLGVGIGVGLVQGRAIRGVLGAAMPWFWACVLGLGAPFLAVDLARLAGRPMAYSLYGAVAVAGAFVGILQARLLARRFERAWAWVLASVAGWSLAAGAVWLADRLSHLHALRGIPGALAYLGLIASGGLVLGAVTDVVLARMPVRESRGSSHVPPRAPQPMRFTFFHVKLAHSVIFWILSACTLYALYSGLFDRVTGWTWVAVSMLVLESVVLWRSGWTCPLTLLAERLGAKRGAVTDIFLPRWFADRIFPVCGTLYAVALVAILWRVFR